MSKITNLISAKQIDMITYSGNIISFNEPSESLIELSDIIKPLNRICRYNGQIDWKLDQHLSLCTLLATEYKATYKEVALCAIHDIHEIYIGDMTTGLKKYCPNYSEIESKWEKEVFKRFGFNLDSLSEDEIDLIKFIDRRALVIEAYFYKHPLYDFLKKELNYKEPSNKESKIFHQIEKLTNQECWDIIQKAIIEGGGRIHRESKMPSKKLVEQFLLDLFKSELITLKEVKEKFHTTTIQSAESQGFINTINGVVLFTEEGLKIIEDLEKNKY